MHNLFANNFKRSVYPDMPSLISEENIGCRSGIVKRSCQALLLKLAVIWTVSNTSLILNLRRITKFHVLRVRLCGSHLLLGRARPYTRPKYLSVYLQGIFVKVWGQNTSMLPTPTVGMSSILDVFC